MNVHVIDVISFAPVFYLYYLISQREYNYEVVAERHNIRAFYKVPLVTCPSASS